MQPVTGHNAPIADALAELLPWLWQSAGALPDDVQARARRLWLDTTSCAWSGLHADEPRRWLALQAQGEHGEVMLPGTALRLGTGAAAAAFALGACWDEACEGLALAHGRPGVPIVAALWTQLQKLQPSWSALWQATAVGYEVGARLGACLRIRPGQHVDGMWSAFGAAVAVAHLRGHRWQMALQALETCAVQLPYSLYLPIAQGANVRNLYLAHSAWLGVQAVLAVEAGMTAPTGAIDEFARLALAADARGAWLPPGRWLILDSYWKPFAGVRHLHYGAAAALRLRAQGPDPAAIEALRLSVYAEAMLYCGNRAPRSVLAAQFSLGFGVAAALCFGDLSPAEYRLPRFDDAQLRRLESLIELRTDTAAFPAPQRGARLEARVRGQWLAVDQGPVVGDPGFEPDAAQLAAKFKHYTEGDVTMAAWALQLQQDPVSATARWPHSEVKE
ncbi:MAG: MmgE/PrpD family protein [Caldimonas sp.]